MSGQGLLLPRPLPTAAEGGWIKGREGREDSYRNGLGDGDGDGDGDGENERHTKEQAV